MLLFRLQRFDESDPQLPFSTERAPYEDTEYLVYLDSSTVQETFFETNGVLSALLDRSFDSPGSFDVLSWDSEAYTFLLQDRDVNGSCASLHAVDLRAKNAEHLTPRDESGETLGCAQVNETASELLVPRSTIGGSYLIERYAVDDLSVPRERYDVTDVTAASSTNVHSLHLRWIPGGAAAVISTESRLFLLDLAEQHRRVLYENATTGLGFQHWDAEHMLVSPDGDSIALVDYRNDEYDPLESAANVYALLLIDLERSTLATLYESPERLVLHGWAQAR